MNTTVSKSFGLALLLAVGIIAVMVAMGAFTSQRAAATIDPATISATPDTTDSPAAITITFTESSDLVGTNRINLAFAAEFQGFTVNTPADVTVTGTESGGATPTSTATVAVSGNKAKPEVTLTLGTVTGADAKFPKESSIAFTIPAAAGIKLPATAGDHIVEMTTTPTATKVNLSLTVAQALGTLDVNPTGAGAVATVTVKFDAINDLPVGDTISIELKDFGVPSSIAGTSVLIRGESGSATADGVSVSGDTIIITIPEISVGDEVKMLGMGKEVTVLIRHSAGITLPTAAAVDKYRAVITTTDPATAATNTQNTNAIEIKRELSLSPKTGAKGTTVTASGKGWGSNGPVMLWIDDGGNDSGFAGDGLQNGLEVILAENVPVSGGAFSATFTADTGFSGSTKVQARDAAGNALSELDGTGKIINDTRPPFKVTGSLSLDKDSVKVNEKLEITLSEHGIGSVTVVTIGGVAQDLSNVADATLTLVSGKATFTIEVAPTTPVGTQVVSVTAGDETTTDTVSVAAVPMTVTPATAALGQEITVSATGFTPTTSTKDTTISSVNVGGKPVMQDSNGNGLVKTVADNNGNITISFIVPDTAGTGDVLIRITDSAKRVGEARITIPSPTLTLSASESRRNSRVTATGTGFVANDYISLKYDGQPVGNSRTDSVGAWSVQFVVPVDAGIGQTGEVTATSSATKPMSIVPISTKSADHKVPGATIDLEPAEAASGDTIKITGSSFPGYAAVDTLSIGGNPLSAVGIQTNGEGFFSADVTVPQLPPGTHNVRVTISGQTDSEQLVIPVDTTQTVEDVFADLIANESLQTIWRYDFDTRTWTSYTTDPETSFANDLFEVESSDILNINVSSEQTFSHQKGSSLFEGWNLITLN